MNKLLIQDNNIKCIVTDHLSMRLTSLAIAIKYDENVNSLYNLSEFKDQLVFGEPIVIISSILENGLLSEKELQAVIDHEVGHILNGDLNIVKNDTLKLHNEYDEQKEFKADQYSISKHGSDVFSFALLKVARLSNQYCFIFIELNKRNNKRTLNMSNILANRIINATKGN